MKASAFTRREQATWLALASVLVPDGGPLPLCYRDIRLDTFVAEQLAPAPAHVLWFMRAVLWFLHYAAWFWAGGRIHSFVSMTPEQRYRVIAAWRMSPWALLRGALQTLSMPILLAYYQDPRVLHAIGVSVAQNQGVEHQHPLSSR